MKKNNATFFKDEKNQLYEHLGPLRRSLCIKIHQIRMILLDFQVGQLMLKIGSVFMQSI